MLKFARGNLPSCTFVTDIVLLERPYLGPLPAKLGEDDSQPASGRGQGHFATKVTSTITSPYSLRHPQCAHTDQRSSHVLLFHAGRVNQP